MQKRLKLFVSAVCAGLIIGLGGTVFLSVEGRVAAAFLFALGLFGVVTFDLALFTGRVCYALDNPPSYLVDLAAVWLGNLAGTAVFGGLLRLTRLSQVPEAAARLAEMKLSDGPLSLFILAVFCGMLMFVAVEGYRASSHAIGKYIAVFLPVAVFCLCGFEHSIANMYFFSVGGVWSVGAVLRLLLVTAGNAVGGLLLPLLLRFSHRQEA